MLALRPRHGTLTFARALLIVFGPFACGYFFSYLYRTVNAVVSPHLREELSLDASQLGLLTAAYFFTFAASQIPLGIFLDRYGPRRVQGSLYMLAAVGALLFSIGESVTALLVARALIGFGVSGGLMAALKAFVQWVPRERLAIVNGWYFAAGGLGALGATLPVEIAMDLVGWRSVFVVLAAGTVLAALVILFVVPDKPLPERIPTWKENINGMIWIYKDPYFWRVAPLMFTCASASMAIQGLWAGPWMADVNGYDPDYIARHLFVMALGMIAGTMSQGFIAQFLIRRGLKMSMVCALAAFFFILTILGIVFQPIENTFVLWGLFGALSTMTSLTFAALSLHFPESHAGRANSAANVFVFAMAFSYQSGIGAIVNLWEQGADGSYPVEAYQTAFLATMLTQSLALIWFFVLGALSKRARA